MQSFSWANTLDLIISGTGLSRIQAAAAMAEIMSGRATSGQIAAFLAGLRTKGESAEELAGMVDGMMEAAVTAEIENVVDIVGTGGDGFGTFNISTTAAFIAAGAGVRVAKHGNRAASSKTGSADLLEAAGFNLELGPEEVTEMIEETGFGFFFAQRYHPAMRHAAPVRGELGVRTAFNFLGPLCNPASARMSVGTSDPRMARLMIDVLKTREVDRGFVVYGEEGLDELSTAGPSRIFRLLDGEITEAEFTPEDFGVARSSIDDLVGGDGQRNLEITRAVLAGVHGPHRDAAVVNASPALVLSGAAHGFVDGVTIASEAIDNGAAADVFQRSLTKSQQLSRSV
ncbi:MAG: anthranilate phosphoribosyltransferase [Actinomycetia bacterium]|nr:anthranilate phosphoribosyltransferase [Actinomycetes bacterium]